YCSDESLEERPFVVRHQVPRQDNLQSQSYLESDTHPLGNPICQHRLADRGEIAVGKRADLVMLREIGGLSVVMGVWSVGRRVG
ncbi:MAG TPA: hypothetical protein VMY41_06775, partial [Thermohalobaculum sp.]|nr:hypothetical protein [Thermohalobaculum sp.]